MIPDCTTEVDVNAFNRCSELERQASAADLSVIDWGRSNWRKLETRFAIVSTFTKLDRLTNEELDALVVSPDASAEMGAGLVFLVKSGEVGLLRLVVEFVA